ncbi:hypothetical protein RB195_010116 [Necator americanus]|uniref:BPTI/Kunitz inhibitor domain-containing protein n=1 Tax=Necator americanus TaxID=51031 RepID=A0ABR1CWI7_NECAM
MYCSGGLCTCLSTYIMREYYCYEKVNPNQPGCTYDVQCEAVWPGAKCRMDSSVGTCRCPEETHVARETRDGWVCVSLKDSSTGATVPLYFVCPLPEGAGFKIALNDPNPVLGSLPVGCTVGSSATVEPVVGLHGGGSCIWPSEGEYVGDIYDCIHTSPHVNLATKFPLSSYAPSADGVCCPSRALACIQPQMTGPNPTEPRWWYNSVTGTCQQFMWDSTASDAKYHSANNFRTIQHCESYCRDTCQRGSPQYSSEHTVNVERPVTSCSSSASCSSDFQCSSIGSQNLCCPTPASVCSARGGRPFDIIPRSSIYHVGFLVTTGKETIRFYYDTSTGRCQDFVYRGAGGNFNNFLSRHECELYCSRLQCERGSPLRIGEEAQRCQHNGQCPSSHECRVDQGVCCPRKPEPKCIQGQAYRNQFGDFVTCNSGVGCPSNYECYYDGNQWGCCPTKAFTCYSNADSGMQCGSGSTFRFYYNVQTQNCESFQYNGCDGNSNNFANRDQCEQYCGVGGCPYGGSPLRDHSGMIAICTTKDSCPSSHECSPVLVGASSVTRCCPKREHMCGLPPQQGTQCGANFVTRFYFNIVTGQCTSFLFGGCDGNYNNFLTIQQCRNFCYSSSCPAGNAAYVDPNSQVPIQCNEALSNSCPSGYSCTFNALINGHVCCGASDNGVCPENEKAFISTTDMSPRECIYAKEQVLLLYKCFWKHRCPLAAPWGGQSSVQMGIRVRATSQMLPKDFAAQAAVTVCPDEAEFVVDEHSQLPRACTMGSFVGCPNGFTCRSLTSAVEGFCCRSGSSAPPPLTDGCPPGNYVFMKDGLVVACDPFNPPNAPCPDGFTCQWSIANQKYQCCGSNPAPPSVRASDGCPNAQLAFKDKGTVRVCTAGSSTCPPGYFCQFSSLNRQFQCCGVSGGCPGNSVAFVGLSGEPEKCVVGQSKCPVGFMCQRSIAGENFCCTVKHEICSNEEVTVDGICLRRVKPGGACLKSEQCSGGATCHRGVCECPASTSSIGGFCQQEISGSSKCADAKSKPLLSEETGRAVFCSPKTKQCPYGYSCQINSRKTQYICCSDSSQHTQQVCPSGRVPYLLNGRPQRCTTQRCPRGYECTYKDHSYICCSSVGNDSKRLTTRPPPTNDYCPHGSPLIYPSTRMPVVCTPEKRACPAGYACKKSPTSEQYICCSSRFRMSAFPGSPCDGYLVLVSRIIGGRIEERCERSCPYLQVPIGGVCYDMRGE